MKFLLFDQNLSPRLVDLLADIYPGSSHVQDVGLSRATDQEVWNYAREHGYMIVSKDADFSEIGLLRGFPPKVVWIRRGNCSTSEIEELLRDNYATIGELENDPNTGVLMLF